MKAKILGLATTGLLATGLFAGPTDAEAGYVYSVFYTTSLSDTPSLFATWDEDSLLTLSSDSNAPTEIAKSSLSSASPDIGKIKLWFNSPSSQVSVTLVDSADFTLVSGGTTGPWNGAGTYCNPNVGCSFSDPILIATIEETSVPAPATLGLLGLGLAGLGVARRRKAQ